MIRHFCRHPRQEAYFLNRRCYSPERAKRMINARCDLSRYSLWRRLAKFRSVPAYFLSKHFGILQVELPLNHAGASIIGRRRVIFTWSARQMSSPSPPFGISCSPNSEFIVCPDYSDKFIGCCITGDCDDSYCRNFSLTPAQFNASYYTEIPDQDCHSGGAWYTCKNSNPPFVGCCLSSPCNGGCPKSNLTAASPSENPQSAKVFDDYWSASTHPSSTSTSSASASASSSSTSASANVPSSSDISSNTIIGASIGGAIASLLLLLCLSFYTRRWLRRRQRESKSNKLSQSTKTKITGSGSRCSAQTSLSDSDEESSQCPCFTISSD